MAYCMSSELSIQSFAGFLSGRSTYQAADICHFNSLGSKFGSKVPRGYRIVTREHNRKSWLVRSAVATEEVATTGPEAALVELLLGVQGRGRTISTNQQQEIAKAVEALESEEGVASPAKSPLIEGLWQLLFTTRPSSASPIQRTFVGVDLFRVFQEIQLFETDEPRVSNIIKFSDKIGELKVEAAASVESGQRILFRFDRAAFSFKFLPFRVPYPVPFRLLGDEAKGWLDTTYLSPSGNFRISRGNKGTTFVLQKSLGPRQRLLQAISSNLDVRKAIDELIPLNPTEAPSSLESLAGKWRLVWSSQADDANWLQKLTSSLPSWQVVAPQTGNLENLVEFFPGLRLKAKAHSKESSKIRRDVNIEGANLELGSVSIPLNITGTGYVELLYLDKKIRISRGNKGSLFVHLRET